MKRKMVFLFSLYMSIVLLVPTTVSGKTNQLTGGSPQQVGMDRSILGEIDKVIHSAIDSDVTPGAVVLVAKDGRIVFENAYGYAQKYDMGYPMVNPRKMTTQTIFDLASVTKVMATTQGIMQLTSEGQIDLYTPVSDYIPEFAANGKDNVTVIDLLTHTSGLTAWAPTYLYNDTYEETKDYVYSLPLEYETGTDRRYSDFSFMMLGYLIEEVSGEPLDNYLEANIYNPLKMRNTFFNAGERTNRLIAATSWGNPFEYKMVDDPSFGYFVEESADSFSGWRDYTLIGEVNDGNSYYTHNGVAGHAGLFSTARDLAVLGQTMLNGGTYGKEQIYSTEVVESFTSEQRFGQGLGWELNQTWYMGQSPSDSAYGHTGFTGTQLIIDPEYDMQIIILTNKQNNGQLDSGSYRSTGPLSRSIVDKVYESLKD